MFRDTKFLALPLLIAFAALTARDYIAPMDTVAGVTQEKVAAVESRDNSDIEEISGALDNEPKKKQLFYERDVIAMKFGEKMRYNPVTHRCEEVLLYLVCNNGKSEWIDSEDVLLG